MSQQRPRVDITELRLTNQRSYVLLDHMSGCWLFELFTDQWSGGGNGWGPGLLRRETANRVIFRTTRNPRRILEINPPEGANNV